MSLLNLSGAAMSIAAARFHDGDRYCAALVKIGKSKLHAVVIDDCGVRVLTEPKESLRHCEPLLLNGKPYPLARLVRAMRRVGRQRAITAAAVVILNEAAEVVA